MRRAGYVRQRFANIGNALGDQRGIAARQTVGERRIRARIFFLQVFGQGARVAGECGGFLEAPSSA